MYTVEMKRAYLIDLYRENIENYVKELADNTAILTEIMRQKQLELSCIGADIVREYRINGHCYTIESALKYVNQAAEALANQRKALNDVKYCSDNVINATFEVFGVMINIGLLPAPETISDEF